MADLLTMDTYNSYNGIRYETFVTYARKLNSDAAADNDYYLF
jgi:hypothetical protein